MKLIISKLSLVLFSILVIFCFPSKVFSEEAASDLRSDTEIFLPCPKTNTGKNYYYIIGSSGLDIEMNEVEGAISYKFHLVIGREEWNLMYSSPWLDEASYHFDLPEEVRDSVEIGQLFYEVRLEDDETILRKECGRLNTYLEKPRVSWELDPETKEVYVMGRAPLSEARSDLVYNMWAQVQLALDENFSTVSESTDWQEVIYNPEALNQEDLLLPITGVNYLEGYNLRVRVRDHWGNVSDWDYLHEPNEITTFGLDCVYISPNNADEVCDVPRLEYEIIGSKWRDWRLSLFRIDEVTKDLEVTKFAELTGNSYQKQGRLELDFTSFEDGEYLLVMEIYDSGGEVLDSRQEEIIVDNTAPVVQVLPPYVVDSYETDFCGFVDEEIEFIRVNGEKITLSEDLKFCYHDFLSEGENEFEIVTRDLAGNVLEEIATVTCAVDPVQAHLEEIGLDDSSADEGSVNPLSGDIIAKVPVDDSEDRPEPVDSSKKKEEVLSEQKNGSKTSSQESGSKENVENNLENDEPKESKNNDSEVKAEFVYQPPVPEPPGPKPISTERKAEPVRVVKPAEPIVVDESENIVEVKYASEPEYDREAWAEYSVYSDGRIILEDFQLREPQFVEIIKKDGKYLIKGLVTTKGRARVNFYEVKHGFLGLFGKKESLVETRDITFHPQNKRVSVNDSLVGVNERGEWDKSVLMDQEEVMAKYNVYGYYVANKWNTNFELHYNVTSPTILYSFEKNVIEIPDFVEPEIDDPNCSLTHNKNKDYSVGEAALLVSELLAQNSDDWYSVFKCRDPYCAYIPEKVQEVYTLAGDVWRPYEGNETYVQCVAFPYMVYNLAGDPIRKVRGNAITFAGRDWRCYHYNEDKVCTDWRLIRNNVYMDQFDVYESGKSTEMPQVGDLMVWQDSAPYGHVGVVVEVKGNTLSVANSNSPKLTYRFIMNVDEDFWEILRQNGSSIGWKPRWWARKK